jgi:predicted XRE-type DNA-binding protein
VADKVEQAIDELAIWGPQLGRPLVDRIHGSNIHNLKELRPRVGGTSEVRLLFVLDAAREAIILVAGDKAGRWSGWYAEAIPLAEERYALYQRGRREGAVMKTVRWEDAKREIRDLEPGWDAPDRVAERERSRAEMRAEQRGYQLAQLRKNAGLTQAQVAAMMGVTQARVSQIEHGKITEVDAIRGYVEALGGTVDVIARVGDWTIKVA